MFHRNSSAEDNDPRIWPSNFRRSATASGPERKSSDQVIQQLRDELDRQRQMFFERLPKQHPWGEESIPGQPSRQGFPFGHQRRPFHHHEDAIPSWMMDDGPDGYPFTYTRQRWPSDGAGSGTSSSGSSSGSGVHPPTAAPEAQKRTDSPSMSDRRMHKPAARSATGDFPPASSSTAEASAAASGFTRASSAPPVGPQATASPSTARRTFTTTVRMDPTDQQTSSPGPNRRQQQPPSSNGPNVRHIPIMVEGRDEPLLPSVAEEDAEKRSKTAIPMPFYPTDTASKKTPPQKPPKPQPQQAAREPSPQSADGSVPIPLPYDRLSDASSDSGRSAASSGPAVSADMELIGRIQKETETLLPRIESFQGDRNDRDFLFLDEMLTRLLLKLDNVQVEGREDVRQARREAITSITRCINLLESKIQSGIARESHQAEPPPPPQGADEEATPMEVDQQKPSHVSELVINLEPANKSSPEKEEEVKPMIETQL